MRMRKYQSSDKDALVSLWQTVFPDDPPHNAPSKILEDKLKVDDMIFLAVLANTIVGACMAGYDGHRGWLYAVAVLPAYRRSGAGTKLVEAAKSALKELGCVKVNLQIRSTNHEAANFYKSLGFHTEDRLSMGTFFRVNA